MYPDPKPIARVLLLSLCMTLSGFLAFPTPGFSKKEHIVYFPNTAYELNVYKIYGKQPGKTLMLIGGIQGNEPGGFLSADLYADMSLARGNLIVVPRANFYSIILNQRGPHGDMNRKFTNGDSARSAEDKIVSILKKLISESDFLLNLHDGAGYYYPKYINRWRNPMRFGQAIIADTYEYRVPGTNKVIKLEEMAQKVLREVNPHIENELHKFHFMNTNTGAKNSRHSEQRKSATYYALTEHHIPAFGVETSKFLPSIDLKVRYHNLVINAFKELFGIIPESPGLVLDTPLLKYLVVSINGQIPIVIKENQTLELRAGDSIEVSHIESNYERGLSLDILGYGDLNDYRREFVVFRDTSIIVRKDNHIFAEIPLKISKKRLGEKKSTMRPAKLDYFVIETKGHRILLSNAETLDLVKGDQLKIVDIIPSFPGVLGITVNFKGFVGDWKNNTGEDRGYVIDTGADLIKRYSLHKKGEFYNIIASKGDNVIGQMKIRLTPPRMDYLVLRINNSKHIYLRPEDAVTLSKKDKICLQEVKTNLYDKRDIHLSINGHKIKPGEIKELRELCGTSSCLKHEVKLTSGPLVLGRIFIDMN
jgi:hypothetical protein